MITLYRPSGYDSSRASSFAGRSIDDKPLNVENGSTFKEIDTGRVFRYDKENNIWIEQKGATPVQPTKPEQAKTVDLNMATGNQIVLPDAGKTLSSATINKPDTMIPANIKSGVDIGGVVGTAPMPKTEQTKTVDLDMATGNQTISPEEGKVLSSVVVTKPTTLVAENIKKDVNIGGVEGTYEGTSVTEPYIEETYDAQGNLIGAVMHGYTRIRANAFYNCTYLALTSLPSEITSIGNYAFSNCAYLALTSLPSGVTSIGHSAFSECINLTLTSLPSKIKIIGNNTFQNCVRFISITFEGTPTLISSTAFSGCTNLTSIKVPWAEGAVANAPWGATNATITYNYTA